MRLHFMAIDPGIRCQSMLRVSHLIFLLAIGSTALAHAEILDAKMHHLRHGDQREWDDFPAKPESDRLRLTFNASPNLTERTLSLRHRDLRHVWKLTLNGK